MTAPAQEVLEALAAQVGAALLARGETLAGAESCTGGWVAMCLTAIAGSSVWFERGFVTYANAAKTECIGVPGSLLDQHGAVSAAVAAAMCAGTLAHSPADWSFAISGIAGPSGGTPGKPVGTVCFGWQRRGCEAEVETRHFTGDRRAVRAQAVDCCLRGLLARLEKSPSKNTV